MPCIYVQPTTSSVPLSVLNGPSIFQHFPSRIAPTFHPPLESQLISPRANSLKNSQSRAEIYTTPWPHPPRRPPSYRLLRPHRPSLEQTRPKLRTCHSRAHCLHPPRR